MSEGFEFIFTACTRWFSFGGVGDAWLPQWFICYSLDKGPHMIILFKAAFEFMSVENWLGTKNYVIVCI